MSEPAEVYEIHIATQDTAQRSDTGNGYKHAQPMAYVRVRIPQAHMRRIDRAAASINVNRPAVLRAIIRQALDSGPAEIVTAYGRSHTI